MTLEGRQFGIIAGSGFGSFGDDKENRKLTTRFGVPSSTLKQLSYGDHCVYVLARHGDANVIPPHRINYRANLGAMKMLGVDSVIALNTVGVIRPKAYPGQLAVPQQIIDYTWGRDHSIYDGTSDTLRHMDCTTPFCKALRTALLAAAARVDIHCHDGGVYGVTQGPRLETAAEVNRFERDGVDYLGMTAMPEAVLAMEFGINYACLSLIVNFAAGRGNTSIHADIDASMMTAKMQAMRVLKAFFHAEP
jgi:purine nucleoside phosphorylase